MVVLPWPTWTMELDGEDVEGARVVVRLHEGAHCARAEASGDAVEHVELLSEREGEQARVRQRRSVA
jgi:hypothetical protein